jgi:hypothetical protein
MRELTTFQNALIVWAIFSSVCIATSIVDHYAQAAYIDRLEHIVVGASCKHKYIGKHVNPDYQEGANTND